MTSRLKVGGFDTDYAKTPGPAGYTMMSPDTYQKKAPAYSMLKRQFMPGGMILCTHRVTYYYVIPGNILRLIVYWALLVFIATFLRYYTKGLNIASKPCVLTCMLVFKLVQKKSRPVRVYKWLVEIDIYFAHETAYQV